MSEYTITAETSVLDYFEKAYLLKRPLKSRTAARYGRVINRFSRALGRTAQVSDLSRPFPKSLFDDDVKTLNGLRRLAVEINVLEPQTADLRQSQPALQRTARKADEKPTAATTLLEFLAVDYMHATHGRFGRHPGLATAKAMAVVVRQFGKMLGHTARVRDFTEENFNRFAEWHKIDRRPATHKDVCNRLLALWRHAAEHGISTLPDKWKRVRVLKSKYRDPNDASKIFQPVETEGSLWSLSLDFFRLRPEIRDEKTRGYYRNAIKDFGVHLRRQPLITDLEDDTVTEWRIAAVETADSISTARERIGRILTLWKWAAQRRVVEKFPTVKRPPAAEPDPIALTLEELQRLFKAAREERGSICGIPAGEWWEAWLAFVYKTAERYGAAKQLRWEWVNLTTGVVKIPAKVRKGKRKHGIYHLEPEAVELLKKIEQPKRELVFPWPHCSTMYYRAYGKILERAGLPNDRKHKTHCLRATHATLKEILGGDAARSLGHASRTTTDRHYIDKRHLAPDPVKLPTPWLSTGNNSTPLIEAPVPHRPIADPESFDWL